MRKLFYAHLTHRWENGDLKLAQGPQDAAEFVECLPSEHRAWDLQRPAQQKARVVVDTCNASTRDGGRKISSARSPLATE